MSFSVQISQNVVSDIERIASWYSSKDSDLEERLLTEIRQKIDKIQMHPDMFQEMEKDQRRALLGSSFPYSIYYSIDHEKKRIFIQGVFHQHKKLNRIREEVQLENLRFIQRDERLKRLKKIRKRSRDLGLER